MVSSRYLPSVSPAQRDARRRLPSRGSCGPWCPPFVGTMLRSDCHHALLRSLRSSLASRYLACFRCVRGVPLGLVAGWKPPRLARAFGHPVPSSGSCARRHVALPRSRVPPVNACPALRPRWCPRRLPERVEGCCLPATGNRRLSPQYILESYPVVHDSTHFGAQSRGLHPRSIQLRTPIAECARGYHS